MTRSFPVTVLACLLLATPAGARTFSEMFPQFADLEAGEMRSFLESLDYQQGRIDLPGGFAELTIPDDYYYLSPEHTGTVLTEAWGNPPNEQPPLGMVFPAGITPFHEDSWAVLINWDPIGYVSDADAGEIDYDELLEEMRADARAENQWRQENGYETIELVGWAAPPHYDVMGRRLHWAKELRFGEAEINTLNYNMRVLGRKGVLVMNFIADMKALPDVQAALPDVLSLARFGSTGQLTHWRP